MVCKRRASGEIVAVVGINAAKQQRRRDRYHAAVNFAASAPVIAAVIQYAVGVSVRHAADAIFYAVV